MQSKHLAIAFWSAAIPFAFGCGIFLVWSVTGWEWLPPVGLFNILLGLMLFVLGSFCLAVHFLNMLRGPTTRWNGYLSGLAVGCLLLLNFPACVAIVSAVEKLENAKWNEEQLRRSWVRIINTSEDELQSVTIEVAGQSMEYRSIASGQGRFVSFPPSPNAELTLTMIRDGKTRQITTQLSDQTAGADDVAVVVGRDGTLDSIVLPPRFDLWND